MMNITQVRIEPLQFERLHESVVKVFAPETYLSRIEKVLALAKKEGLTHLIIYADREHFANLHYFTGFDPRFEEALLILAPDKKPLLLLGNEGVLYATIIPYDLDMVLFQSFSLNGQQRDPETIEVLDKAFNQMGIKPTSRLGLIGWKYFIPAEGKTYDTMFDLPHFLVEKLEQIVTLKGMKNVASFMVDPSFGLRTTLDVDEIAVLELAGTKTSRSVLNFLSKLKPGVSEIEASSYLEIDGDPLIAHPVVNFTAEGIRQGLASPGSHKLQLDSVCNVGFGYRSSMVARTGLYTSDSAKFKKVWDELLVPYFRMMVIWYETIGIGVTGKTVVERIKREIPEFDSFGIGLNPGHLIHNDEWTTSVFTETDDFPLRNGMAIQSDIIAAPVGLPGMHLEDGLALADSQLRANFKEKYPEAWQRIERRRNFMKEVLGIQIKDEVLPFSDIQGCMFPWMADLGIVMAVDKK